MNLNARIFGFLVLAMAALGGCSSGPSATDSKKTATAPDRLVGKAQVLVEQGGATDSALNAGGPSIYLWQGERRYRLFLKNAVEIVHGSQYVAEGVYAQKAIDDIGDPDQGKNGYPLESSVRKVINMAWKAEAFDAMDADVALLRAVIKRYPARALFLVSRIRLATDAETGPNADAKKGSVADDENIPEVEVTADKERALLAEGATVQTAPLWDPAGETVKCKVLIGSDGKIASLETGMQLCESVQWSQLRFQPTVQKGRPVKVRTEVEMRFDPRK